MLDLNSRNALVVLTNGSGGSAFMSGLPASASGGSSTPSPSFSHHSTTAVKTQSQSFRVALRLPTSGRSFILIFNRHFAPNRIVDLAREDERAILKPLARR
jgi:hypothetical protein